jgi:hypothetical protein
MPINDGLQDPRVDRERSIEPIHNPGHEGDAGSYARALNRRAKSVSSAALRSDTAQNVMPSRVQ